MRSAGTNSSRPPILAFNPGHGRIAAVGQTHDQVLDATEPLARAIQQRTAQDRR